MPECRLPCDSHGCQLCQLWRRYVTLHKYQCSSNHYLIDAFTELELAFSTLWCIWLCWKSILVLNTAVWRLYQWQGLYVAWGICRYLIPLWISLGSLSLVCAALLTWHLPCLLNFFINSLVFFAQKTNPKYFCKQSFLRAYYAFIHLVVGVWNVLPEEVET